MLKYLVFIVLFLDLGKLLIYYQAFIRNPPQFKFYKVKNVSTVRVCKSFFGHILHQFTHGKIILR